MKVIDWLGRVTLLVLSGLASLSIIGSIAAIPTGGGPIPERSEATAWDVVPPSATPSPSVRAGAPSSSVSGPSAPARRVVATEPPPASPTDWLEPLTYAVVALAVIVAAAVVVLLQLLRQVRRIADAQPGSW